MAFSKSSLKNISQHYVNSFIASDRIKHLAYIAIHTATTNVPSNLEHNHQTWNITITFFKDLTRVNVIQLK